MIRRYVHLFALIPAVLLATACASSGGGEVDVGASRDVRVGAVTRGGATSAYRAITTEQRVDGLLLDTPQNAWSRLPGIYEALGIEVTHSDPATFTMGTRAARVRRVGGERLSRYLDCGMGPTARPYANEYDVTLGVMVQLTPVEEGTRVTVRVEANAKPRDVSGHAVACSSKGTLEQRILNMISLPVGG